MGAAQAQARMQVRLEKLAAAVVDLAREPTTEPTTNLLEDPAGQRDQQAQGDRRNRP